MHPGDSKRQKMSSDTSYKAAGTFGFREIILHWLTHVKLSRIILLVTLILVIVPLITHYYLSKVERDTSETDIHRSRLKLEAFEDLSSLKASELKFRIEEMLRIKDSVSLELRDLEARRQRLQAEVSNYNQRIEELKTEMLRQQTDLERLKISVEQAQVAQREAIERNSPELALPKRLLPPTSSLSETLPPPMEKDALMCRMHRCFDYSRCALTSGLPVYLYDPESYQHLEPDPFLRTTVAQTLGYNPHFTPDPAQACLFIVLVGDVSKEELQRTLPQLPYWRGDGRNHVLLHLTRGPYGGPKLNIRNLGRAMIAQTSAVENEFRLGFDILVPPAMGPPGGDVWQECAPMLPARRRVLLSYQGELQARLPTEELDQFVVSHLQGLIRSTTSDRFILNFSCPRDSPVTAAAQSKSGEWLPCGTEASRSAVLRSSTYTLILAPSTTNLLATPLILSRFSEALKHGAIPVLLGDHLIYLASVQALTDTLVAAIRDRLSIPPLPVDEEPSPSAFNSSFVPLKMEGLVPDAEADESLGPIEPPYPSPRFRRNHSLILTQGYELWNDWGDPFRLYPQLPFDPALPSDAKFIGSGLGFRPIGHGAGGSGREFSEALGGNLPREQFTIVLLTYEREQVLLASIGRLLGLPYLNKVVVVWNSPKPPVEDLRWPDIGVPVHVIKAGRNSLNNRFLPYDVIETEAILSVDDDAHLRHDEIMFGFSYWMPQAIRDKVDEYMNCEDIAMNFLVSHITRKPPVKVTSRWTFRCPGCPVSLSEDDTHFQERHKCINFFTEVFGYTPLLNTQFRADSILFKTRIPHDKQKCFKFI
ncbi:hypothetical protein B566_EDAN017309 [Ephemera danica]|nr:hypothetical protein B566_EDAN017309 [Ephemera danica]